MNTKLFRSIMVLNNDTNKSLAEFLNLSEQTVRNKINENGTEFRQGEIAMIKDRYNLTADQIADIFFN
jgi:arsenate reductase-like glutaredoxin family protein